MRRPDFKNLSFTRSGGEQVIPPRKEWMSAEKINIYSRYTASDIEALDHLNFV